MPKKKDKDGSIRIADNKISNLDVSAITYNEMDILAYAEYEGIISPNDAIMLKNLLDPTLNGNIDPRSAQFIDSFSRLIDNYISLIANVKG